MLKSIWFFSLLWFFSGVLHAEEIKLLQFKQAINLSQSQTLDFEIKGLAQDEAFWTAVYLVAQQGKPDGQAHIAIEIQNDGGLNIAHPASNPFIEQLKAEQLPRANGFSLLDLPELSRAAKHLSKENIDAPALPEGSAIRVYAQLLDWTPVYNQGDTVKLSFGFPTQEGLYAVAAYVFVGQGRKPKELLSIRDNMPQVNQLQAIDSQVENASSEASGAVPQKVNSSANSDEFDDGNRTRMLLASLAIILLGYWLWRRRR